MAPSCEKVSARLQPATAGHARLVLSKQLEQIYTSLYIHMSSFVEILRRPNDIMPSPLNGKFFVGPK